jgi:hypothetical protein
MKFGSIFVISAFFVIFNGKGSEATKCPSTKCVCIQNEIKCEDFESFAHLNFSDIDDKIEILDLKPREPLILDDQLDLAHIQIKKQIQQHITTLALTRVSSQLKEYMTPNLQAKLIDSNISQLGGQI